MASPTIRLCLICVTAVSLLPPLAAQERPRSLADAIKVIDFYKGTSAIDLSPEDIARLTEAREMLVDLTHRLAYSGLTIADAKGVTRILKGADPGKLNFREAGALRAAEQFLKRMEADARRTAEAARSRSSEDRKEMTWAVDVLEEILYVPAEHATGKPVERTGDAKKMLGIWTLRRMVGPTGRVGQPNWTVVVLDGVLVHLDSSGEVKVASPYRLGRYGEKLTAIDFALLSPSARADTRGIIEAGDSRMRIAFSYRYIPRPESFREPARNVDPILNPELWEFEREPRLSYRHGPGRELKEINYQEARGALADLEVIVGSWQSQDGNTRLTFTHDQVDSVTDGKRLGRFTYRLTPLTAPGVMEINPRAFGLVNRPGKFTAEYKLDGETLVLKYLNPNAAPSSPNFFDRPEDFPKPGPNRSDKDPAKTKLTLKRVAQNK